MVHLRSFIRAMCRAHFHLAFVTRSTMFGTLVLSQMMTSQILSFYLKSHLSRADKFTLNFVCDKIWAAIFGKVCPCPCFLSFFFFFCGRSAALRPSVHMLPGTGWCGAGLPPFPTACWWLTHPVAITRVSVSARWDSPGGWGGQSVPLLCNRRVQSPWCQFASGALAGHNVLFATWI